VFIEAVINVEKNGNYHKIMCFDLFEKYGIENCKIYLVERRIRK
jgi:hypothetical protein